jgi:hypothetical protein
MAANLRDIEMQDAGSAPAPENIEDTDDIEELAKRIRMVSIGYHFSDHMERGLNIKSYLAAPIQQLPLSSLRKIIP